MTDSEYEHWTWYEYQLTTPQVVNK